MDRNFLDNISSSTFSFECDILEKLVDSGCLYAYLSNGYFIDIGVPEDYERAQSELKSQCSSQKRVTLSNTTCKTPQNA
jgi:D-glycero-alpha-D-manno-heptose 1-phosphate guanylyltransferase